MSKRAYDKIAEGLKEAIAIARGEAKPAKLFVPPELDVRAIRTRLHLSQEDFASIETKNSRQRWLKMGLVLK